MCVSPPFFYLYRSAEALRKRFAKERTSQVDPQVKTVLLSSNHWGVLNSQSLSEALRGIDWHGWLGKPRSPR